MAAVGGTTDGEVTCQHVGVADGRLATAEARPAAPVQQLVQLVQPAAVQAAALGSILGAAPPSAGAAWAGSGKVQGRFREGGGAAPPSAGAAWAVQTAAGAFQLPAARGGSLVQLTPAGVQPTLQAVPAARMQQPVTMPMAQPVHLQPQHSPQQPQPRHAGTGTLRSPAQAEPEPEPREALGSITMEDERSSVALLMGLSSSRT
jgi:hypothetical protein